MNKLFHHVGKPLPLNFITSSFIFYQDQFRDQIVSRSDEFSYRMSCKVPDHNGGEITIQVERLLLSEIKSATPLFPGAYGS